MKNNSIIMFITMLFLAQLIISPNILKASIILDDAEQKVGGEIGYATPNYENTAQDGNSTILGLKNANLNLSLSNIGVNIKETLKSELSNSQVTVNGSSFASSYWGEQPSGQNVLDVHGGGLSIFKLHFSRDSDQTNCSLEGQIDVNIENYPDEYPEETMVYVKLSSDNGSGMTTIWQEDINGVNGSISIPITYELSLDENTDYLLEAYAQAGTMADPGYFNLKSRKASFSLTAKVKENELPGDGICNVYGVFIGVKTNRYFPLTNIKTGEDRGDLDAQLMYDLFSENISNFKEGKVLKADFTSNPIKEITQTEIENSINQFDMDSDDIFIFYAMCHGDDDQTNSETTSTAGDEYLQTATKALFDDDLTRMLESLSCQKWVILDACHSGGFWGNDEETSGRDLDSLNKIGLFAAAHELTVAFTAGGRGIFTSALSEALSPNPLFSNFINADMDSDHHLTWSELTFYTQYLATLPQLGTVVYEMEQGDPIVFNIDMWTPVSFASEDFDVESPSNIINSTPLMISAIDFDPNEPDTLKIQNYVSQLSTDPNHPYANQGLLTYVEKAGNLNLIDSNDIFYKASENLSSKIISSIPNSNWAGKIKDFNELSKDARPFLVDPNDPNSLVLLELSIYNPWPNDPNISSENYLRFWISDIDSFEGKLLTIQQISTDPNVEYPVWDIRTIISKNKRKLPMNYIEMDPDKVPGASNMTIKIIKPNVPYAWFTLSTNREIIDINEDSISDYNDFLLLIGDLGREGILRSDIASLKNGDIVLGIPDGKVDETDKNAFITEYNRKHPEAPIPNSSESFFEDFESGMIQEPFIIPWSSPWVIDSDSYDGQFCAKSGDIGDNQKSVLEANINAASGNVSFWRKVSSEYGSDELIFYIDDLEKGRWSGYLDWEEVTYQIIPGAHTFKWEYKKDWLSSDGEDAAWIDDININ